MRKLASSRFHFRIPAARISPLLKFFLVAPLSALLILANVSVALAHWEPGTWPGVLHWDKTGAQIVIQQQSTGAYVGYAEQARQNGWNTIGILRNYDSSVHTDISAYSVYVGDTGPAGQWHLESCAWDWSSMACNHITHAHSWFNEWYAGPPYSLSALQIQAVFCQEIAHGWGLDHSDTGDCMGYGYYRNDTYYYGPHNNDDFYNFYRNH
jgi:hypothetical protein